MKGKLNIVVTATLLASTVVGCARKVSCHDVDGSADVDVLEVGGHCDMDGKVVEASMRIVPLTYKAEASVVREISVGKHLKVDKDVVWVTPDMWEQIRIMGNLEWEIV